MYYVKPEKWKFVVHAKVYISMFTKTLFVAGNAENISDALQGKNGWPKGFVLEHGGC